MLTEKEGFEPSRQGFSPPNALAGRRLQPLGHFSECGQDTAPFRRPRRKFTLQGHGRKRAREHHECAGSPLIPPGTRRRSFRAFPLFRPEAGFVVSGDKLVAQSHELRARLGTSAAHSRHYRSGEQAAPGSEATLVAQSHKLGVGLGIPFFAGSLTIEQ